MKIKYAKIPKKYRVTKSNPSVWRIIGEVYYGYLFGIRYHLRLLSPVCWILGHHNRVLYPYGVKIKQCQRCAKVFYKLPTREKAPSLYGGELGTLYGVRFISTKK